MKRKSEGEFGVENTFGLKNQIARLKFKLRIFIPRPEAAILIHTKLFLPIFYAYRVKKAPSGAEYW